MGARLALMLAIGGQLAGCNVDVWLTPDQQGRLLFQAGEYERAAESFSDPAWRATALHRAGRYQQAAEELALLEGEQPAYKRGVALALAE